MSGEHAKPPHLTAGHRPKCGCRTGCTGDITGRLAAQVETWFGTGFSGLLIEGDPTVIRIAEIRIADDRMNVGIGDRVVATARFSENAAADGNGPWIVSTHLARLFSRNQAITALTLAECLAVG